MFQHTTHITGLGLKNLLVGLFNAGSLCTRQEEFVVAVEGLAPDILAINETWLREGEENRAPRLPGYRLKHIPRPSHIRGGRGGGIGFYIRKGLNIKTCTPPNTVSSIEQMWITVRVNCMSILVGTAYRPPWQDISLFLDAITESVTSFSGYDGIVLTGDFNINLLEVGNSRCREFSQCMHSLGLNQCVQEPTHYTDHSATLIDVICTDVGVCSVTVKHSPDLGGHAMLVASLKVKRNRIDPVLITYRPLKDIILNQFYSDLSAINWENLYKMNGVSEMVSAFAGCIKGLFDLHAPVRTRKFKHPPHPWITDTIKEMMRCRDAYHSKYKKDKTVQNEDSYRSMKKLVSIAIEREKTCFFSQHINMNLHKPKLLWKNLKKTLVTNSQAPPDLPQVLQQPDSINSHFLNVPGEDRVTISQLSYFEHHRHNDKFHFKLQTVNSEVVLKTIKKLGSNAQGHDGITLDMILLTLPHSLDVITAIVNRSILDSTFPESWKVAIVKPLPKTSQPATFQELRPISILPCLSKILEKVVCEQLTKYLDTHNILPRYQSGFRRGYGTATALADVVDNLLAAQDQGKLSLLLLLDFSRAFDSLSIPLLLSKLSYYGLDPASVRWFHSYLTHRQQYVELKQANGTVIRSKLCQVNRGVPQGSILGPILYILYSADIVKCIQYSHHHLYADDLQLYLPFTPSANSEAVQMINSELDKISGWCSTNSLTLNAKKSKLMLLGSPNHVAQFDQITFNVVINGERIERVDKAKNLGLTFDSHLRFESHISECARNCFYRLKLLYKLRPYLSEKLRVALCESLVLSRLNYCDTVYGPCLLVRTAKLVQRVQNACTRFCFKVPPRSHITPFLNSANIIKMEARRKLHLATMLFGVISSGIPKYLFDKLKWSQDRCKYQRRACTSVFVTPRHRLVAFRGSFRYAATRCWNNLPPPLRALKVRSTFKKHLRHHLLHLQKADSGPVLTTGSCASSTRTSVVSSGH